MNRTKDTLIFEIDMALFIESGILLSDKMVSFLKKQKKSFILDLANLVRYTRTNKRLIFEFN